MRSNKFGYMRQIAMLEIIEESSNKVNKQKIDHYSLNIPPVVGELIHAGTHVEDKHYL